VDSTQKEIHSYLLRRKRLFFYFYLFFLGLDEFVNTAQSQTKEAGHIQVRTTPVCYTKPQEYQNWDKKTLCTK